MLIYLLSLLGFLVNSFLEGGTGSFSRIPEKLRSHRIQTEAKTCTYFSKVTPLLEKSNNEND